MATDDRKPPTRRGYVDVDGGQLHYASAGVGRPVVLIHQTPRSWDEYRDVLPILGSRYRAIAFDSPGFGASDFFGEDSIEAYAAVLQQALVALSVVAPVLVGHHTGALVALELAARDGENPEVIAGGVHAVVLSASPFRTADERAAALAGPGIDEVKERPDGEHLTELWQRRQKFYPHGRPDLLRRFVSDALRLGNRAEEGHRAVNRYAPERRASLIRCPVLAVCGTEDPYSYPALGRLTEAIPHAKVQEIPGGMVPLPDQMPAEFADAVDEFVNSL